jgi:tripartite-type tricarboxylate transporter receptor subunit TctC
MVVASTVSFNASGQANFPQRPVRMVNPYTPGGSVDLVGRHLAAGLAELWGYQVIVDNRPGAGTTIGTEIVVRADPDGYTALVNSSAIAIMPTLYKKLRFDPVKDLATVSIVCNTASMLAVNPGLPAKTVKDLIELARAQPGRIPAATSGVGSTNHLILERFKTMAKIDLLAVPYKGGGPAMNDLIGGQVRLFFNTPGTMLPHAKVGRLRILAVTGASREDYAPEVPTIAEAGVPGFEAYIWYGVYLPKNIPAPLMQRWNQSISQYLKMPAAVEHMRRSQMRAVGGSPEDSGRYHAAEVALWSKVAAQAGVTADQQ